MHFILLLALVPCLCVLSVDIPSQPESPVGGYFGNQQLLTGFDNAQLSAANNEINSESPGAGQLVDDKKSATSSSSVTRHQFKVCSSMTILPLHDYGSCSRTIHRLAGAVCRGIGNGSGNLGVNSIGFGGRKRRSSSSTGSAGGDETTGEEELEDALLEFTNGNRNHHQNGFWAQEQQQSKRAANFYGNQQQQQQPQFQQTQQQQPAMYGGHHLGGLISVGHHEQVKKELIRKCCKYSNVCQIEFVVENLSDSCNGHSYQQHQQKEQPLHVAKARA